MNRPSLLPRIVAVQWLGGHRLDLRFSDGVTGQTDLHDLVMGRGGVMSALDDPSFFSQVRLNPEAGTIEWPNNVDFCPDVLYERVKSGSRPATAHASLARP